MIPHCATNSLGCQLSNPDLRLSVWNGVRFAQLYKFSVVRSDRRVNELAGIDLHDRRWPFFVICPLFRRLKRLPPPARPSLSISDQRVFILMASFAFTDENADIVTIATQMTYVFDKIGP